MSDFAIPKKFSLSLNFPKPLSPKLSKSFILKNTTGETAKAGKTLSAGNFGVPFSYIGVSPKTLAARAAVRPSSTLTGQTLLKTGNQGGKLKGLGKEIVR